MGRKKGFVIGAVIQLGRCFDLTNIKYTDWLRQAFETLRNDYEAEGLELPKNEGKDFKARKLDCLVINTLMTDMDSRDDEAVSFQTVRCPFEEGVSAFEGSLIKTESHIQIAVRDHGCILGVFLPNA